MKKIAIFVEGLTEFLFTCKLIEQLLEAKNFHIHHVPEHDKTFTLKKVTSPEGVDYFFMIYNAGGDNAVKSRILSNYKSLENSGYMLILGLRDVYPESADNIDKIKKGLNVGLEGVSVDLEIVLAIMEIEAWFIQKAHFERLNPILTPEKIAEETGFDFARDHPRNIEQPSALLNTIYEISELSYTKKRHHINTVLSFLDFDELYINDINVHPELHTYIKCLQSVI